MRKIIILLSLCFLVNGLSAQSWEFLNTYNSDLPTNELSNVFIDNDGIKWIATSQNGFVKYNGQSFVMYDTTNTDVETDMISLVITDEKSNVWVGTYYNGLYKYDGNDWIHFSSGNSDLPGDMITSLLVQNGGPDNAGGAIWVGTYNGGLAKYDGASWEVFNYIGGQLPDQGVLSLAIEEEAGSSKFVLWVGTANGLVKYNGSEWINFPVNAETNKWINAIAFEDNGISFGSGKMYVGTESGEFCEYNGSDWTIYNLASAWNPNNSITDIEIDSRGWKWIATDEEGIAYFNGSSLISFYEDNSEIPGNKVVSIALEEKDNSVFVWMCVFSLKDYLYKGMAIMSNSLTTSVKSQIEIAGNMQLQQNYPNPFKESTTISYNLDAGDYVSLKIYDIYGKEVETLFEGFRNAGKHEFIFDCNQSELSPGIYIYKLSSDKFNNSRIFHFLGDIQ